MSRKTIYLLLCLLGLVLPYCLGATLPTIGNGYRNDLIRAFDFDRKVRPPDKVLTLVHFSTEFPHIELGRPDPFELSAEARRVAVLKLEATDDAFSSYCSFSYANSPGTSGSPGPQRLQ